LFRAAVSDEDPVRIRQEDAEFEFDGHPVITRTEPAEVADVRMAEVEALAA
jgi:hypothetical protein